MQIIKAIELNTTNSIAFFSEIIPDGISLIAVRGFLASKFLSSQRLKAIAALLAKPMQSRTNINNCHHGFEVMKKALFKARKKPINAKGIAKMV